MTDNNQGSTSSVTITPTESAITNLNKPFQARRQTNQQIIAKVMAETEAQANQASGIEGSKSAPDATPAAPPVKEPTAAEQRKEFLVAQKAIRKAQEEQKKAKEAQDKAEKEAAKYKADWKTSPTKYMEQIGLNPDEVYKAWTNEYLGITKEAADPIEEKIKAAVSPYIQQLEEEKSARIDAQNRAATEGIIVKNIIPLLANEAAKEDYGTLLLRFGNDHNKVAEYVYTSVMNHWVNTGGEDGGEMIPFAEAMQQLENAEVNLISKALPGIKGMKKYSKYFSSHESPSTGTTNTDYQEQPKSTTRTLTNALKSDSIQTSNSAGRKKSTILTNQGNRAEREARIAEVLAELENK